MLELGSLTGSAEGRYELRLVRRLEAPPERVWAALTERDELDGWLGRLCYQPAVGSPLTIDFGEGIAIWGELVTFDAPRDLAFTWSETPDLTAASVVRFELGRDGAGTRLVLTHSRQSTPMARSTAGGWHAHLDLLIGHLEGQVPEWDTVYAAARAAYEGVVAAIV